MIGNCDLCGKKLVAPCWIIRLRSSYPFHKNQGGLYRYCTKRCFEIANKTFHIDRKSTVAAGKLG